MSSYPMENAFSSLFSELTRAAASSPVDPTSQTVRDVATAAG